MALFFILTLYSAFFIWAQVFLAILTIKFLFHVHCNSAFNSAFTLRLGHDLYLSEFVNYIFNCVGPKTYGRFPSSAQSVVIGPLFMTFLIYLLSIFSLLWLLASTLVFLFLACIYFGPFLTIYNGSKFWFLES